MEKINIRINLFILAIFAIVSCSQSKEQTLPDSQVVTPEGMVQKTFHASATKTGLDSDGLAVVWSASDQISVFDETSACASYAAFAASGAGASADFTGFVDASAAEFYALYPYNADATWDYSTRTITTNLSHKQTGVASSFADGLNLSVAKEDGGNLVFKNLGALLRFTITSSDITAIVIKANNSEKLAGDVSIVFDASGNPSIDQDALGVAWNKVQLLPESGSTFAPGTYNIVVLPFGLTDGLTVNVTKTDNKIYSKAKKTAATVAAGRVFELGTLDSGLNYDRDKLALTDPKAMTLLFTGAQKNAVKDGTGTTLVQARTYMNTRGKGITSHDKESVSDADKATTDPETFYSNAHNISLLTLNAFMYAQMGNGSLRTSTYGTYATPLLVDWAEACMDVEYSPKRSAGPMLARACFPWFVYYQFAKLSDNFSTATQRSTIEAWFRKIVNVIKESQADWQSNNYYDAQYYQNHLVACVWGLVSAGYALGDMSIVEYALDSIDNPRDFYDCLQGCILMAGDTPSPRDPNAVAPQTGEIIDRYRHTTATNKGLQYASLTLQMLSTIARSVKNAGGPDLFAYTCPTGENLELAYTFYAPFYASTPPDASLQGGYYTGESERIGLAGDLHGLFELGYNAYPSNTAIQSVISAIPDRASNNKASAATYPNNAKIMQMHDQLGYTRLLSVDVDTTN